MSVSALKTANKWDGTTNSSNASANASVPNGNTIALPVNVAARRCCRMLVATSGVVHAETAAAIKTGLGQLKRMPSNPPKMQTAMCCHVCGFARGCALLFDSTVWAWQWTQTIGDPCYEAQFMGGSRTIPIELLGVDKKKM